MNKIIPPGKLALLLAFATTCFSAAGIGYGATITMTASDALYQSSFTAGTHWSGGAAPSAGNTYVDTGYYIRTPSDGNSYSFPGDSLTIGGGGVLLIKSYNNVTTTINNLILDNGIVFQNNTTGTVTTVAGNINLGSGGGTFEAGLGNPITDLTMTVSASVSGTGSLQILNANTGTGVTARIINIVLTGSNSYSGGTTIGNSNGQPLVLEVGSGSSLGSGSVTVVGYPNASAIATTLKLDAPTCLASSTALTLGDATNTDWALNLAFTGVSTVAGLSINGTTYTSPGTYGAVGSGATFTFSQFTGAGLLTVGSVPAQPNLPSSYGDNFDSYSAGDYPNGFSSNASGAQSSTWSATATHELQGTVTNNPTTGGAFAGIMRGVPFVGATNQRNFIYTSKIRAVSSSSGTFQIGLVALAGTQPYFLTSYYYAGMTNAGVPFLKSSNTSTAGLTLGTATNLGVPMAIGTNYTFTLKGSYVGAALNLSLTVTDGTYTASISGVAAAPLTGINFGYQCNTPTAGSNMSIAVDDYSINIPIDNLTLSFEDEFDGTDLNTSVWSKGYRWANALPNELQAHRPENVTVANGVCQITIEKWAGTINNVGGYAAGTTVLNVSGFTHAIPNGTALHMVSTNEFYNVASTVGGNTPTQITLTTGLTTALANGSQVVHTAQMQDMTGYKWGAFDYRSGSLQTYSKWAQPYGYFEARIKMASAVGTWPAFWLLPDRGVSYTNLDQRTTVGDSIGGVSVPMGNEIDITEYMAAWRNGTALSESHSGYIYHIGPTQASANYAQSADGFGATLQYSTAETAFHTYGVYWAPNLLVFYLDGKVVRTSAATNVSIVPEYMILNTAVALNNWGVGTTPTTALLDAALPCTTQIDYVRVWSLTPVMDNNDANGVTATGAWTSSTATAGYYGADYLHDGNTGKGSKSMSFTPNLPIAGGYEVFARWTAGSDRASNVPIDIVNADTTNTVVVNQQINGGQWVSLGTYNFYSGTAGSVLIRTTGTSGYVIADAVKFVPVPEFETILDNNSSTGVTITGTWTAGTGVTGYWGSNYLTDGNANKGSCSVSYSPYLPNTGTYEVFARWTSSTARATNVPIDIISATGTTTVQVNQQANGGTWVSLGTYTFNTGTGGKVVIRNTGTADYVVADAIRFVRE